MKLALISYFPPTVEAIFGPSSFIYHLLKNRPEEVELYLFYYYKDSINIKIEDEIAQLNPIEIHQIHISKNRILKFFKKGFTSHKFRSFIQYLGIRYKYPNKVYQLKSQKKIIRKIDKIKPDLIWLYPHMMFSWYKPLTKYNILVSGPDSSVLVFERLLKNVKLDNKDKTKFELFKKLAANLEKSWGNSNAQIHFVGKDDVKKYKEITKKDNCFYFRHPFNNPGNIKTEIKDVRDKISILIAKGVHLFNRDHIEIMMNKLAIANNKIKQKFKFKLLGRGFEKYSKILEENGFDIDIETWVDSYKEELNKHQIQIIAKVTGAGTKNSVLDSLASGLLCIGSKYSFENIEVVDGEDMLMYNKPEAIVNLLKKIINDPIKYSNIAKSGKLKVRQFNDPQKISIEFFYAVKKLFGIHSSGI